MSSVKEKKSKKTFSLIGKKKKKKLSADSPDSPTADSASAASLTESSVFDYEASMADAEAQIASLTQQLEDTRAELTKQLEDSRAEHTKALDESRSELTKQVEESRSECEVWKHQADKDVEVITELEDHVSKLRMESKGWEAKVSEYERVSRDFDDESYGAAQEFQLKKKAADLEIELDKRKELEQQMFDLKVEMQEVRAQNEELEFHQRKSATRDKIKSISSEKTSRDEVNRLQKELRKMERDIQSQTMNVEAQLNASQESLQRAQDKIKAVQRQFDELEKEKLQLKIANAKLEKRLEKMGSYGERKRLQTEQEAQELEVLNLKRRQTKLEKALSASTEQLNLIGDGSRPSSRVSNYSGISSPIPTTVAEMRLQNLEKDVDRFETKSSQLEKENTKITQELAIVKKESDLMKAKAKDSEDKLTHTKLEYEEMLSQFNTLKKRVTLGTAEAIVEDLQSQVKKLEDILAEKEVQYHVRVKDLLASNKDLKKQFEDLELEKLKLEIGEGEEEEELTDVEEDEAEPPPEFRGRLQSLETELDSIRLHNQQLQAEITKMKDIPEEEPQEDLTGTVENLTGKVAALQTELENVRASNAELQKEIERQQAFNTADAPTETLQTKIRELEQTLEEKETQYRIRVKDLQATHKELKRQFEELELEKLKLEIGEGEEEEAANEEGEGEQAKDESSEKIESLQAELASVRSQNEVLKTEIAAVKTVQQPSMTVEVNQEENQRSIETLRAELESVQAKNQELLDQLEQLQTPQEVVVKLGALEAELRNVSSQNRLMKEEIGRRDVHSLEAEMEMKVIQTELTDLRAQNEKLEEEGRKLSEQPKQGEPPSSDLQAELVSVKSQNAELQAQNAKLKAEAEEMIQSLEKELGQVEESPADSTGKRNEELKEKLEEVSTHYRDSIREVSRLKSIIADQVSPTIVYDTASKILSGQQQ